MKKLLMSLVCGAFVLSMVFSSSVEEVKAYPPFLKTFIKQYPDMKGKVVGVDDASKSAAVKCYLCHIQTIDPDTKKKSKKKRNAYGKALDKFLTKKDKKKANVENVFKALKKVETMKQDSAAKTYGELLKAGELPQKIVVPPKDDE